MLCIEKFCEYMQDRLWEAVDKEWMDCLRKESVGNLLQIPSGVVQVVISISMFFARTSFLYALYC